MTTSTPADSRTDQNTDKPKLSRSKAKTNDEYAAFARRTIRAYARRVAAGDIEALAALVGLADEVEAAAQSAVSGLHSEWGYSWTEIAARLDVTRQAARQRWTQVKP